jgi:hypothetical protein
MAGFCTSCGSPLGDGQAFCTKCGARLGASQPPAPAQASPAPPSAPPAAPVAGTAPAAAKTGTSAGVKILLIIVGVIFLFGAMGVGAVMYIGYRIRQKAHEMGLTSENRRHSAALQGSSVDGCKFLSKEEVSTAIGMTVVRAEPANGSAGVGCSYSVMGDVNELTMKHAGQLMKSQNSTMSKEDQEKMESIGKGMLQGTQAGNSSASDHPGEVIVLTVNVDENAAQFQMKLNRGLMRGLGPMATQDVPNLGEEAFAVGGSILMVRKADTLARFMYMQCPCGTDEIVPLAQKVVGAL